MNILYLHSHDSGRYFDPYGYAVGTPAITELARRGTLFRQAYSAAPTCSPSRAALLTGTSPHRAGMLGLAHRGFRLHDYGEHLARHCKEAGYRTALSGIQHEAEPVDMIGYDEVLDDFGISMANAHDFDTVEYDLSNTQRAAEYLSAAADDDAPFFLSYGMFNTHREFPPIEDGVEPNHVLPPREVADTPEARVDHAGFITSARVVDRCVRIVMDALDASGLRDDTIVIFTTDHGVPFPFNKCTLYDTGIGVALILDFPGNPARGSVVEAMVSQLDLFPTLCELTGLPKPERLEGRSMLPLLTGEQDQIRDELYAEVTYHAGYDPQRAIRTRDHKLIKRFAEPPHIVPVNIDASASKHHIFKSGIRQFPLDAVQLYDLNLDPLERVNVADDPAYADVRAALEQHLDQWMQRTEDPLLDGHVPLPPGAFQDSPDSYNPDEGPMEYAEPEGHPGAP
ncbi:MAG: sulfatase [Alkalispirochaeta sp.]